jgi:hypothetical protein
METARENKKRGVRAESRNRNENVKRGNSEEEK